MEALVDRRSPVDGDSTAHRLSRLPLLVDAWPEKSGDRLPSLQCCGRRTPSATPRSVLPPRFGSGEFAHRERRPGRDLGRSFAPSAAAPSGRSARETNPARCSLHQCCGGIGSPESVDHRLRPGGVRPVAASGGSTRSETAPCVFVPEPSHAVAEKTTRALTAPPHSSPPPSQTRSRSRSSSRRRRSDPLTRSPSPPPRRTGRGSGARSGRALGRRA